MANSYFQFKQFTIQQPNAGMKVTTDACLFGAWVTNIINAKPNETCLDIGTGTGLLTCMLAQKHHLQFICIDINEDAINDAANNIKALPFNANIQLIHTALQVFKPDKAFDVIICNPPFFTNGLKGQNQNKTLAMHNDILPLETLLNFIAEHIAQTGEIYILYAADKLDVIKNILKSLNLFIAKIAFVHQTELHNAFRIMLKISLLKTETIEEKIIIKQQGNYSPAFISLLQPYYLHL